MRACLVLSLCLCTVSLCLADPAKAAIRKDLNVPAEDLSPALQQVATTYELQVLYPTQVAKDLKTHGAVGSLTSDEALTNVLSGTGLSYKYLDANTVTIVPLAASQAATAAGSDQTKQGQTSGQDGSKEGDKSSSSFRVAQVDQGQASSPSTVEKQNEAVKKTSVQLEEVVVTGSRIPVKANQGPQDVKIYTRENIEQSGQTTVGDFINTLPSVSAAVTESGFQTAFGSTTVNLRGLPFGATLVLINGRRVESSGTQTSNDFFDLNNLPLAAVDRIEVVADGSSAIYGSDAIAGVVNIILKRNFDGFEATAKYAGASGTHESDFSLAWGKQWDRGSVSVIGSYQDRSELIAFDRALTANNDYTAFGGPDHRFETCSPGDVFSATGAPLPGLGSATYAAVPAGFTGTPSIQEFQPTAGTLNKCSLEAWRPLIPAGNRGGVLVEGSYEITPWAEVFTELMYSHIDQESLFSPPFLFGQPGFQSFTVAASNPYNPFGTTVGISGLLTTLPRTGQVTDGSFQRELVGVRGTIPESKWHWEVSGWYSGDYTDEPQPLEITNTTALQAALNSPNPSTALNPFIDGPLGSQAQLNSFFSNMLTTYSSRTQAADAFLHGPLLNLPAGAAELVIGGEYDRASQSSQVVVPFAPKVAFDRSSYAFFSELKVPILANHDKPDAPNILAVTAAGRFDHYSDFGSTTNPQLGLEWRPVETLLIRGTYATGFKAPPLPDLYSPATTFPAGITDPKTGQFYLVNTISGGYPYLRPETSHSKTAGIVYTSDSIPNLRVSATYWNISEDQAIEALQPQFVVDNESLFPGRVIRDPSGMITLINATFANLGTLDVSGVDYQLNYSIDSNLGRWTPSVSATQTVHYVAALTAGVPATDRLSIASDDGVWAPRWKGTMALDWSLGPSKVHIDARYTSKYQDYDSPTNIIGNFWLFDTNIRYEIGRCRCVFLEIGGVNVFNRLPQYSNYGSSFLGYDPTQADIRGRFLYAQVGMKL